MDDTVLCCQLKIRVFFSFDLTDVNYDVFCTSLSLILLLVYWSSDIIRKTYGDR